MNALHYFDGLKKFLLAVLVIIAAKAMILNGLGFANRALYLTPHLFADKPVERLLGHGIEASHLNDDTLGRALDAIYEYDLTKLYPHCAINAINCLKLDCTIGHLDSTKNNLSLNHYVDKSLHARQMPHRHLNSLNTI